MSGQSPSLETWQRLYELAKAIKTLAPWGWMQEDDLFGVEHPDRDEIGFVSVMGMLGEHYAIVLYLGAQALYDLINFVDQASVDPNPDDTEELLSIRQLQLSFEDHELLHKEDRATIKEAGMRFRGRGAWPLFRSYQAGYQPWFITGEEAEFLVNALEQLLEIAPRLRNDRNLFSNREEYYLVRQARPQSGKLIWSEETRHIQPPPPPVITMAMDEVLLAGIKRLPKQTMSIAVDFFMLPAPVGERHERPKYPYILLVMEDRQDIILDQAMMVVESTREALYGQVPLVFLRRLAGLGALPIRLGIRPKWLYELMKPLGKTLGIRVQCLKWSPTLDNARYGLREYMKWGRL